MNISDTLSGATRVIGIIGDPIAQVKSPSGVTQRLIDRGCNAVVVPLHVASADLATVVAALGRTKNFDGLIITVPHKLDAYALCATTTERAHFLGGVNVLRRRPDGRWHGDHADGLGFIEAQRSAGCELEGRRVLLAGAGGAGSAIAQAALEAGASLLAIHDGDLPKRDGLIRRLAQRHGERVQAGSADPRGFDVVFNATPAGMRAGDALPVMAEHLDGAMFVGDVITMPAVTPLLEIARSKGCRTQVGAGMFAAVCERMVDFLLETGPLTEARLPTAAPTAR
ncbi:shikimate dehydrogenase [Sphaerotilus hippei]|uniref:Shikimate dehydrogenase n=1 Tax=Sphaerotilus hippei TaxID=744406 RepID=A0A318H586_9BURK|nr:shikimate dehydrogenase [Sphaerotilus hippei]PXW97411.1 shikimate dehydrogenase [Sphaerotilus hippei]